MDKRLVDLNKLKKAMLEEFDGLLIDTLEEFGFKLPRIKDGYIQCGFNDNSSGNSIIIKPSDQKIISFKRYSNGQTGDIIDLFLLKEPDFYKTFKELKNIFKTQYDVQEDIEVKTRRKDFIETIKSHELQEFSYEILPENFIGQTIISALFLYDKIKASIQLEFQVWECEEMNRICLNWRDYKGNLVGSIGRYNGQCFHNKYLPVKHNFKKTLHLFGLFENLIYILNSKRVYIFEAEKSVLQTASNGHRNSVSSGYANISANQLYLLQYLKVKEIFICPDEDIDIIEHFKQLRKVVDINGFNFEIYYIWDKNKKYLIKGSKMSPADLLKNDYEELIKTCVVKFSDLAKLTEDAT